MLAAAAVLTAGAAGFYWGRPAGATPVADESGNLIAPGYALRRVADQFTAPVGAAAGDRGEIYVAESGADTGSPPRVLKVIPDKGRTTLAADFPAPLTGITWFEGKLYVSYAGGVDVLDPATGLHHAIITKLPARGDHPNRAVVVGPDRKLYFGIGSATNAGIAGPDNAWLKTSPDIHDIPCQPLKLRGANFTVPNPLTEDPLDMAATGAFSPFGKTTARLQAVPGALPCTGALFRTNLDGTGMELVAWGLRNPAGIAFSPDQQLFGAVQGFANRGSRPVPASDPDYLYRIQLGAWYGWPDYAGGRPAGSPLLAEAPGQPPLPLATFPHASEVAGLLFPPERFGLQSDALAALPGDHTVVRVNVKTGSVVPFLRTTEPTTPVSLTTGPANTLFIIDAGRTRPGGEIIPGTGILWRVSPAPLRKSETPTAIKWQWALVGLIISIAGARLAVREN